MCVGPNCFLHLQHDLDSVSCSNVLVHQPLEEKELKVKAAVTGGLEWDPTLKGVNIHLKSDPTDITRCWFLPWGSVRPLLQLSLIPAGFWTVLPSVSATQFSGCINWLWSFMTPDIYQLNRIQNRVRYQQHVEQEQTNSWSPSRSCLHTDLYWFRWPLNSLTVWIKT